MSFALLSYLLPRRHAKMRIGLHTDLSHHIPSITNLVSSHLLSVVAHVVVFFVQVLAWDLLLQRFPFSRLLLFSLSRHASLLTISEVDVDSAFKRHIIYLFFPSLDSELCCLFSATSCLSDFFQRLRHEFVVENEPVHHTLFDLMQHQIHSGTQLQSNAILRASCRCGALDSLLSTSRDASSVHRLSVPEPNRHDCPRPHSPVHRSRSNRILQFEQRTEASPLESSSLMLCMSPRSGTPFS